MTRIHGWIPILIMLGLGAGFGAFNIGLSLLLGPKKPTPEKLAPYECGMPPVGDARERHPVKFYLVAMIFLLFDIEVAFLYPWAMALRDLGWNGFVQVVLFVALLFLFGQKPIAALAVGLLMLGFYVPMAFTMDRFLYQRHLRKEAQKRAEREAQRTGAGG